MWNKTTVQYQYHVSYCIDLRAYTKRSISNYLWLTDDVWLFMIIKSCLFTTPCRSTNKKSYLVVKGIRLSCLDKDHPINFYFCVHQSAQSNLTASEQTVSNRTKQWYDRLKRVIHPNNLPMVLLKLAKTNIMI